MRTLALVGLLVLTLAAPAFADAKPVKEWTLLLFLNGNNNLNRFGRENLIDMERVGSTDELNLVVQWADIEYKTTQRLYITKSDDPSKVSSPVVQSLGKTDMGDWKSLVEFIKWGVENYPAKHYFIDVWDHGTGWHELKVDAVAKHKVRVGDISHDETTGHWITTPQLSQAVTEAARVIGHKVDVYGSDACLMAMVEIATEMSDAVSVYVGSEIDIPVSGWPYAAWLAKWAANPKASPAEVAKLLHTEYIAYYRALNTRKKPATLSVFDLERTDELLAAIRRFSGELGRIGGDRDKKQALEALIQSTAFTMDYNDLLDFADKLEVSHLERFDYSAIAALREASSHYVLANGTTQGFEGKAKGISIWLPGYKKWYDKYLPRYRELKFSKLTGWENGLLPLLREIRSGS